LTEDLPVDSYRTQAKCGIIKSSIVFTSKANTVDTEEIWNTLWPAGLDRPFVPALPSYRCHGDDVILQHRQDPAQPWLDGKGETGELKTQLQTPPPFSHTACLFDRAKRA
ncbi:hypothetical protein XENORESO_011073, partial [Xenotaenia resolanae]